MYLLKVGQSVIVSAHPESKMEGTINGYGMIGSEVYYIVWLSHGFYSEGRGVFVTQLLCHPDSVAMRGVV